MFDDLRQKNQVMYFFFFFGFFEKIWKNKSIKKENFEIMDS